MTALAQGDVRYVVAGVNDQEGSIGPPSEEFGLSAFDSRSALYFDLIAVYDVRNPLRGQVLHGTWQLWAYIYRHQFPRAEPNDRVGRFLAPEESAPRAGVPAAGSEVMLDVGPLVLGRAGNKVVYNTPGGTQSRLVRAHVSRSDVFAPDNYLGSAPGAAITRSGSSSDNVQYIGRIALDGWSLRTNFITPELGVSVSVRSDGRATNNRIGTLRLLTDESPSRDPSIVVDWGSLTVWARGHDADGGQHSISYGLAPRDLLSSYGRVADARGSRSFRFANYAYRPDIALLLGSPRLGLGGQLWKLNPDGRVDAGESTLIRIPWDETYHGPANRIVIYKRDGQSSQHGFIGYTSEKVSRSEVEGKPEGRDGLADNGAVAVPALPSPPDPDGGPWTPATEYYYFRDDGTPPDLSETPPYRVQAVPSAAPYQGVGARHEQRFVLAGGPGGKDTLWFSSPGDQLDFIQSGSIVRDTDAFRRELAANHDVDIRHLVPSAGGLLALTSGGEWLIQAGNAPLTPTTTAAIAGSYVGCNHTSPVVAQDYVLFVGKDGSSIYALQPELEAGRFNVQELTLLIRELLEGWGIVSMAWSEQHSLLFFLAKRERESVIWACTFIPEENLVAFSYLQFDPQTATVINRRAGPPPTERTFTGVGEGTEDSPEIHDIAVATRGSRTAPLLYASAGGRVYQMRIDSQDVSHLDRRGNFGEDPALIKAEVETFPFRPYKQRDTKGVTETEPEPDPWKDMLARPLVRATSTDVASVERENITSRQAIRLGLDGRVWPPSLISADSRAFTMFGDFRASRYPALTLVHEGYPTQQVLSVGIETTQDVAYAESGMPVLYFGGTRMFIPEDRSRIWAEQADGSFEDITADMRDALLLQDQRAGLPNRDEPFILDWAYAPRSQRLFLVVAGDERYARSLAVLSQTEQGFALSHFVIGDGERYRFQSVAVISETQDGVNREVLYMSVADIERDGFVSVVSLVLSPLTPEQVLGSTEPFLGEGPPVRTYQDFVLPDPTLDRVDIVSSLHTYPLVRPDINPLERHHDTEVMLELFAPSGRVQGLSVSTRDEGYGTGPFPERQELVSREGGAYAYPDQSGVTGQRSFERTILRYDTFVRHTDASLLLEHTGSAPFEVLSVQVDNHQHTPPRRGR